MTKFTEKSYDSIQDIFASTLLKARTDGLDLNKEWSLWFLEMLGNYSIGNDGKQHERFNIKWLNYPRYEMYGDERIADYEFIGEYAGIMPKFRKKRNEMELYNEVL